MDKQTIADLFMRGQDCSQVVAARFADELGCSDADLSRMTAAFGGGLGIGETCGAVIGAMVVMGMKYGNSGPDEPDQKAAMNSKRAEFLAKWHERRSTTMCRDFLGHDIAMPGEFEKVIEEGTMFTLCPELVIDAIEILEEIL